MDRLGAKSQGQGKERPRLAARACAQQQPFTSWRFRVAWPRPQLMNLRREEDDPTRSDRVRGRREIRSRESLFRSRIVIIRPI